MGKERYLGREAACTPGQACTTALLGLPPSHAGPRPGLISPAAYPNPLPHRSLPLSRLPRAARGQNPLDPLALSSSSALLSYLAPLLLLVSPRALSRRHWRPTPATPHPHRAPRPIPLVPPLACRRARAPPPRLLVRAPSTAPSSASGLVQATLSSPRLSAAVLHGHG